MSKLRIILITVLLFLFVANAFAGDIKHVKPEKVGLSSERLARLGKTMQKYADDRILPGAVILIARDGKIAHLNSVGMMDVESGKPMKTDTIFRLASMTKPLYYQPGTRWVYSFAHDVQGYLVEHFSGMTLDKFMKTRLFDPLDMSDTSFNPGEDKIKCLATMYFPATPDENIISSSMPEPGIVAASNPPNSEYMTETHNPSGGSGLLCTAEDYFRFAQMLLNGGRYNGKQILSSKTVEFMIQNHIEPETDTGQGPAGKGSGYGLGVGIVLNNAANGIMGSKGQFGWGGYATTSLIIDPEEDMISILMSQTRPAILPIWHQFQTLAYQTIID